jgi:Ca2+-dependent lipid-binding protein
MRLWLVLLANFVSQNNPTVLTLKNKNGEASRVKVSLKYIPVLMKLDPSESISNMGTLRVEILDAANLLAMDRNGKSDPFCIFELEGKEVFKSKVQKKTLHPSWNEHFETKIVSRTAANFVVEVHDWDMASKVTFTFSGRPIKYIDVLTLLFHRATFWAKPELI